VKRYDSIGSAPAHRPRAEPKRFGPGHFRLGRLNEAVGVWGRRGPLLEFESIFHWKSLTTGLFYESIPNMEHRSTRLPLLIRERNRPQRKQRKPRPTSTRSVRRASGSVMCWACSAVWGCKSPAQPDGGEGLARTRAAAARRGLKEAYSKCASRWTKTGYKARVPDERATYREVHIHQGCEA
jgi:hypothetical protein